MLISRLWTEVLFEASRRSSVTLEGKHGRKEYTDQDDAFHAILGSELGKVALNMILDHKLAISYKMVDRVVLLGRDIPDQRWDLARTFLLLLSEPRSRKRASTQIPGPEPERKRRRTMES